jgi:hypothetical protein
MPMRVQPSPAKKEGRDMPFNLYWHLPILIVVISLVYSATRYDEWKPIFREAVRWGLRLAVFLFVIGLALYLFKFF